MDDPARNQPRHRPARVALLGVALVALLALVAAASRAHHTPGASGGIHQPPRGVGDYLFSIFAVVVVGGALLLLYLWFSERDLMVQAKRNQQRGTYRVIAFILVVAAVASVVSRFHSLGAQKPKATQLGKTRVGPRAKPSDLNKLKGAARPPTFQWLPVFVATAAGMVLLGYIGLRAMRRARGELVERHALEQQLESLLDDTLDDLYAQKDPRAAIVAAYARMERLFASSGVPRRPAEAPMEYLGRALGELRASGAALGRLTGLFQWAKFSSHRVDESMREEAIVALSQVRDELRANREEDKLRRAEAERHRDERLGAQTDADREQTFGEDPFAAATERMRGSLYGRRGV